MSKKEEIKNYLKETLEFLDGRGLILTDDELIEEALEEMGDFKTLTRIIKGSERERMIEMAGHYLCEADDVSVEEQVALIEAQAEIDDTVFIDHVDDVIVWEKVEFSFTVRSFLDEITPFDY